MPVFVPWYKFTWLLKLLLRGKFNGRATVKTRRKNGLKNDERCGELWGKAASKELRTYQPSGKWSLATIPSIEFDYFDDGETTLRAYRDTGEAKASSASRRVLLKFLLKCKQSGTIVRQKTRA